MSKCPALVIFALMAGWGANAQGAASRSCRGVPYCNGVIDPTGFRGSDLFAQITSALSTACAPAGCSIDARQSIGKNVTTGSGPLIINKPVHLILSGNIVNEANYSATVVSAIESGTTATITMAGPSPFSNGWVVQIAGVSPAGYNGVFQIFNATSTTFQYTADASKLESGSGGMAAAGMLQIGPGGAGSHITCEVNRDAGDARFNGLPVSGNLCALVDTPRYGFAPVITLAGSSLTGGTWGARMTTLDNLNLIGNTHITDGIAAGAGNQITIIERSAFTLPYGAPRTGGPTGTAIHFSGRIADSSVIRDNVINGWRNGIWSDASTVGDPGGTFGPIIENNYLVQQTGSFLIKCSGCFDAWIVHNSSGSSNLEAGASGILLDGTNITPFIVGNHFDGDNYPPDAGKGQSGIIDIKLSGSVTGGVIASNSLDGNTLSESANNDPDHAIDIGFGVNALLIFGNYITNYCKGGIKVAPGASVSYLSNRYVAGLNCGEAIERISGTTGMVTTISGNLDVSGNLVSIGALPTTSAGIVTVNSTNLGFEVTGATAGTTIVTFADGGFANKPSCSCNNESATTALKLSVSKTTLTVEGLSAGNGFMCTCIGH